jgi:hypothetical protein
MTNIKIYIHVSELSGWQQVLDQQYLLIQSSGLLDAADTVFLCGNGQSNTFIPWMKKQTSEKLMYAHCNPHSAFYEYPTLNFLHSQARDPGDAYQILYIHLKGLSRPADQCMTDWRNFLQWAVIERWQECVQLLADHDCVGANWETEPWPHFSGNFWWARSDYVATLPALIHPEDCMNQNRTLFKTHYDGGPPYWRFDMEAWIGSGNPRYKQIAKSFAIGAQHYNTPYPAHLYRSG